jgi:hypothetical protein
MRYTKLLRTHSEKLVLAATTDSECYICHMPVTESTGENQKTAGNCKTVRKPHTDICTPLRPKWYKEDLKIPQSVDSY